MIESVNTLERTLGSIGSLGETSSLTKSNFGEILKKNIDTTNDLLNTADKMSQEFAIGKQQDLHTVMIAVEQANLAFNYTMEIRNRIVEGYQEIMRMQI